MGEAKKRLYKFLVRMERITPEQYEQIVGEIYEG
ncbi:XkdX family protein [Schnuerera sp.]|nr:XkdX family protein [Schnuerera sp.]HSH35331.1 XkdX family protein [Schnuerera sp.]